MPAKTEHRNCPRARAVIATVEAAEGPFTAIELYRMVKKVRPDISRATLYRTLRILRAEGRIKDIILPNGLHVSIHTDSNVFCVVECEDCGRFRTCSEVARHLQTSIERIPLIPSETAIYVRGRCRDKLATGRCQFEGK
jgi:Fe2+ or Zn2+ uptake regulation protein